MYALRLHQCFQDMLAPHKKSLYAYKKYYHGKQIYQKGNNAYWYKWSRHFLKVGPLRTGAMWEDGYTSKESIEYYRGGASAPVWEWFGWDADSKANGLKSQSGTRKSCFTACMSCTYYYDIISFF